MIGTRHTFISSDLKSLERGLDGTSVIPEFVRKSRDILLFVLYTHVKNGTLEMLKVTVSIIYIGPMYVSKWYK